MIVNQASGEGMDRQSLALPGDQDRLITAVARNNPRTIIVLNTPGPVLMPWLDKVAAVLQVWYPGEQFGTALARVLFGDDDPGGRLPVTFPAHAARDQSRLPSSTPESAASPLTPKTSWSGTGSSQRITSSHCFLSGMACRSPGSLTKT